ncbi:hypothetical protein LSTR_LSTR015209 [Laodelphax striatellus]|uniref:Uncharacterized protein n=1 Tax=Laodelphax striatellus TaxID=195883 RepID=A0A482X8W7_LAOST|nr:hypothetical protein LSTR_LSTR015209 [Laodelphax striatellus]
MDVEYKDEEGNTALHHVLELFDENEWKYQSFVEPLLSKGARLDAKNKEGIAYRLNGQVSAFEDNNIQELLNNALVPYKRTKDVAGSIACGVLRPSDNKCLDKSQKPVVNSPKNQNKVQSQISDQKPKITIPQHLVEENPKESVSKANTNITLTENSLNNGSETTTTDQQRALNPELVANELKAREQS